ncbi:hypothetical protein [Dendronalium sp. ChiSLP03b]|nr:hypothetical protein [Dendronalium sp. ChiSLP03b]
MKSYPFGKKYQRPLVEMRSPHQKWEVIFGDAVAVLVWHPRQW